MVILNNKELEKLLRAMFYTGDLVGLTSVVAFYKRYNIENRLLDLLVKIGRDSITDDIGNLVTYVDVYKQLKSKGQIESESILVDFLSHYMSANRDLTYIDTLDKVEPLKRIYTNKLQEVDLKRIFRQSKVQFVEYLKKLSEQSKLSALRIVLKGDNPIKLYPKIKSVVLHVLLNPSNYAMAEYDELLFDNDSNLMLELGIDLDLIPKNPLKDLVNKLSK